MKNSPTFCVEFNHIQANTTAVGVTLTQKSLSLISLKNIWKSEDGSQQICCCWIKQNQWVQKYVSEACLIMVEVSQLVLLLIPPIKHRLPRGFLSIFS